MGYIANHYDNKYACDGEDHDDNGKDKSKSVGRLWLRGGMRSKSKKTKSRQWKLRSEGKFRYLLLDKILYK